MPPKFWSMSTYMLTDFYCYCQLSKEVRLAFLSLFPFLPLSLSGFSFFRKLFPVLFSFNSECGMQQQAVPKELNAPRSEGFRAPQVVSYHISSFWPEVYQNQAESKTKTGRRKRRRKKNSN